MAPANAAAAARRNIAISAGSAAKTSPSIRHRRSVAKGNFAPSAGHRPMACRHRPSWRARAPYIYIAELSASAQHEISPAINKMLMRASISRAILTSNVCRSGGGMVQQPAVGRLSAALLTRAARRRQQYRSAEQIIGMRGGGAINALYGHNASNSDSGAAIARKPWRPRPARRRQMSCAKAAAA